ncbi:TPA: DUF2357 domain-containing protein [Morganella morganii]|uniref:DUF2357 domain-containing protein n=1 Tax=Morganella morganii TaxID=582 RepID=UPI00290B2E0B|nr:DUF2357 domain-containing protein [Morganella morganii]MDU3449325.1 DUF2357 domain-containing protein [Morganella morganii]MDU3506061.1 DUF2357 domain-containing protein [Morganella morganii]HBL6941910.1 DUF2357 domain-containing protein [Morganella morganii]
MRLRVWEEEDRSAAPTAVLDIANQPIEGFSEQRRYLIECPEDLQSSQLYVDDVCLQKIPGYWMWQPGFYAGEVDLELILSDQTTIISWRVDVSNDPDKSGRQSWQQFIQDIIDFDSIRLVGSEPSQHQLGGISRFAGVWLRYARIKQFFPRYAQGLKAVLLNPVQGYEQQTQRYTLGRLKKLTPSIVQQLIQHTDLLTKTGVNTRSTFRDIQHLQVQATYTNNTWDAPANRQLKFQLNLIDRRVTQVLTDLKRELKITVNENSGTRTSLKERLTRRINHLTIIRKHLRNVAQQLPFSATNSGKSYGIDFDSVVGHPHYQLTWRMGVRLLRDGISGLVSDESHYLIPSWEIYEVWCFIALTNGLKRKFPYMKWNLLQHSGRLTFRARHEGLNIKLHNQKSFRAILHRPSMDPDVPHSISGMRRPDLVLEVENSGMTQFICLDSKYTSRSKRILEEMASAHIYHDSLRWQRKRPVLSLLLVPRNEYLAELESESWWQAHQTGCFTMQSVESSSHLLDRLWAHLRIN